MMGIQTKNTTETTRNFTKQKYCVGRMGEYQNHHLTGSKQNFGKNKAFTQQENLKIWEDEIKLTVQESNLAFKKYLQTKTIDNETEYNRRRATAKREIRKRHH